MSNFSQRIANLPPKKRAAIEQWLLKKLTPAAQTSIPRRYSSSPCSLSFAQEKLWFLEQLESNHFLPNISRAVRVRGHLNQKALEQVLQAIVARHEALRTTFLAVDGIPMQAIAQGQSVALKVIDLRECSKSSCEAEVQRIVKQESQRPFNLSCDLMLRTTLLRLGKEEHIMVLVIHPLAADEWSIGILCRELSILYEAFLTGSPSPLPELPIQYADFACWQRQWLQGEVLAKQLNYWQQQLGIAPPLLQLPTDKPRPLVQTFQGSIETFSVSLDLTEKLKTLGQRSGATLFMTLLAALGILLNHYTGQEDVLIGSPIAHRNRPEIEGLIGLFGNTLALRLQLAGNPTFKELLDRVREVTIEAYSHQELPFEKLVEELSLERDLSYNPLFSVMLALQNGPKEVWNLPNLNLSLLEFEPEIGKLDWEFHLWEVTQGLKGYIAYNASLFDQATMSRIARQYQTLLEGIVANPQQSIRDLSLLIVGEGQEQTLLKSIVFNPEQTIGELPLLTAAERQQLLVEWNDNHTDYPRHKCIHELWETQVEKTPDAVAVVFEDQQLTYGELNARANQLAHYLQSLGVGPEKLVGICVDRSLEMVIGLLGILKAGGAYLPLDPTYPTERLAFMLSDAQVSVLLTQQKQRSPLPPTQVPVLYLDRDWNTIAQEKKENLASEVTSNNLAYVIYTSGSTGKPKGVLIPHRAVTRLVINSNYLQLTAEDTIAQASNISFDAATFEIWGALLNGARLVVIPKEVLLSPQTLARQIQQQQIRVLFVTTAWFNELAKEVPEAFQKLHCLLFGGEAVEPKWVWQILQQSPPQKLLHVYGPTEGTTFSTFYWVKEVEAEVRTLPIGRPLSNTHVYLLDDRHQPVPVGVPGELYLGGDGLARGYLNRSQLTTDKFLVNPFQKSKGKSQKTKLLYKTGDLARYLPDGNIEFLGRIDDQVKIRGFRIEIGEIEALLGQHSQVEQRVVLAREDIPGEKRLVAYVVAKQKSNLSSSQLRLFLKQKLPEYMIPSAFILLDVFPLTVNGKIDRQALPIPESFRQEPEVSFVAPRDELEFQLAQIWQKVLRAKRIGISDNFFDLGGHSLLAVKLLSEIEKAFHQKLSLAALFQAPTIEKLAEILRQKGWSSPWYSLVPIQPSGSKPPLFFIQVLGEGLMYCRNLARHLGLDQPMFGLNEGLATAQDTKQIKGGPTAPTGNQELATHYIQEIRTLQPQGPYYLTGVSAGGNIALEMAQQLYKQGQKVALLALLDSYAPYTLKIEEGTSPFSRYLAFWQQHLTTRLSNLWQLQPKERLSYVLSLWRNFKITWKRGFYQKAFREATSSLFVKENQDLSVKVEVPSVYPGKITVFKASKQIPGTVYSPTNGWETIAAGGLDVHLIPGDHSSMLHEPNVRILAEKMRASIEAAHQS